eukprot:533379-Hanusia_phi.AAC.1
MIFPSFSGGFWRSHIQTHSVTSFSSPQGLICLPSAHDHCGYGSVCFTFFWIIRGVGLSSSGAGDGPGVMRPRRRSGAAGWPCVRMVGQHLLI